VSAAEARAALASALAGTALSATETARILELADCYGAALINACARSPRDLGVTAREPRHDTAEVRRWARQAGLRVSATGPLPPSVTWLYDSAHRGSA
jgi:hypothetical protein